MLIIKDYYTLIEATLYKNTFALRKNTSSCVDPINKTLCCFNIFLCLRDYQNLVCNSHSKPLSNLLLFAFINIFGLQFNLNTPKIAKATINMIMIYS